MSLPTEVGFYGKLPSHGDFLRRRVSDAFVSAWDPWLQECLASTRTALGDSWLDIYLTSPAWRFGCAAGALGPSPVVGVMVPSVDRVGRYFHLALVAELPADTDLIVAATKAVTFFEAAEELAIDTLAADPVDFDGFDNAVLTLGQELELLQQPPAVALDAAVADVFRNDGITQWQIPLGTPPQLSGVLEQILSRHLSMLYEPLVLWWTGGSGIVEPSFLISKGLPDPGTFAALLDGAWSNRGWQQVRAAVSAPAAVDTLIDDLTPPRFRSAGASDVGRVRSINQDSYLERSEAGVWVVADGLGGHDDGEIASRMVCDALADFTPAATFEEMIDGAQERIHRVNEQLIRETMRTQSAVGSGSTVVALLARRSRCAVIWAGDSRVYRLRNGQLERLTRDHSLAESEEGLAEGENANAVTRAVGGEPTLALDLHRDRVNAGDRFLLCSDGLTRTLQESEIRLWVAQVDIRDGVEGLIKATLEAGAPDNVTALIVEAFV